MVLQPRAPNASLKVTAECIQFTVHTVMIKAQGGTFSESHDG